MPVMRSAVSHHPPPPGSNRQPQQHHKDAEKRKLNEEGETSMGWAG